MTNNFGFDLNNTPDLEFQGIPDGTYPMLIDKVHKVAFDNGKKIELSDDDLNPEGRIEFMFQVAEGSYANAKYNQIFNVYDEGTAGNIARSTIKKIVECCGVDLTSASFDELQNKIVVLEIKSTASKTDPSKVYQNIKKVSSMQESAVVSKSSATVAPQGAATPTKPSWGL